MFAAGPASCPALLTGYCWHGVYPVSTIAATVYSLRLMVRWENELACPFFVPTTEADDIPWLHPSRLPLGRGWNGHCGAPGHEGFAPTPEEIKQNCNLGYATTCPRLPKERDCDAVRFSVVRHSDSHLVLWFVFELQHRPAGHGTLEYKVPTREWKLPHPNERIQRMADCYVQSYLSRRVSALDSASEQLSIPTEH